MAHLEDFAKETYFEEHGYSWDERYDTYVNHEDWKIFHKDYINDHSFDLILVNLREDSTPGQWKMYFNTESPLDIHNIQKHYGAHS
jgi:hypothetical protein